MSAKRSRSTSPNDITHLVRRRRPPTPNLIERTNALSLEHLTTHFLPPLSDLEFDDYAIELTTSASLNNEEFSACFDMLETNMKEMYSTSTLGWHPKKKKTEMRHPAMRYLILTSTVDGFATMVGFLSFMITEEEGDDVIYTYELNLLPTHQKLGLGKKLLYVVEHFGTKVGVEKAMLTVFERNKGARKFYEREGYQLDETSPGPISLRGGLLKEPSYHILSKSLK